MVLDGTAELEVSATDLRDQNCHCAVELPESNISSSCPSIKGFNNAHVFTVLPVLSHKVWLAMSIATPVPLRTILHILTDIIQPLMQTQRGLPTYLVLLHELFSLCYNGAQDFSSALITLGPTFLGS